MRAFTPREMVMLYRATRGVFILGGIVLIGYGAWYIAGPFITGAENPISWFGVFPIYVGAMLILVAIAMKEDWFTNARRYW